MKMCYIPGTSSIKGVAIRFHSSFNYKLLNYFRADSGRYIIANVKTDKECYTVVNIYAPNNPKERNTFFKQANEKNSECSVGSIILGVISMRF